MQPSGCLAAEWLVEDDVPRCPPLSSSNLMHVGGWRHARGREHYGGEPGSALSGGYTHQIRRGPRAARSSTSRGRVEPLCARIKGANREVSKGKADPSPRSVFFLRRLTRSGERARFVVIFQGCTVLWTAGWMLARAPASPAQGLHHHGPRYFNVPYLGFICGLEKLGLVDQN